MGRTYQFVYCEIDGNGKDVQYGGIITQWGAGLTVEYSWVKNAGADMFQAQGGGAVTLRYNLLDGAGVAMHGHSDYLQSTNGPFVDTILFNTIRQVVGNAQGLMLEPDDGGGNDIITSGEIGYNTMVTGSGDRMNYFIGVTVADIVSTVTVHDNYFDARGAYAFAPGGVRGGPNDSSPKTIFVNNVNMATGAVVQDANATAVATVSIGDVAIGEGDSGTGSGLHGRSHRRHGGVRRETSPPPTGPRRR